MNDFEASMANDTNLVHSFDIFPRDLLASEIRKWNENLSLRWE